MERVESVVWAAAAEVIAMEGGAVIERECTGLYYSL